MNTTPYLAPLLALALLASSPAHSQARIASPERDAAVSAVARIQRADYEGDRVALQRLYKELTPLATHPQLGSRIRYWQGFALWRRAVNGFNDSADPAELEQDLQQAIRDFAEATKQDPAFVDASIGAASCMGNLMFLYRGEPAKIQELLPPMAALLKDSLAKAPDNPRLLWVQGPTQWYTPAGLTPQQIDERQARAIATYVRGLQLAREQKAGTKDPLEPAWGEPELLMSLAWSNLNRRTADLRAAEEHAGQALALVPYWHYVRDILMPQIRAAKVKQ